jgi:DNA-binding HxlR family transcriptional regulator
LTEWLSSHIILSIGRKNTSTVIYDRYYLGRKYNMIRKYIENSNFEETGFSYTLSLISGKHKMVILYCLMEFEVVRFNELKRYLKNVTDRTLSTNLKELETNRLIIRKEYPQIPPKVEYSLSDRGKSLMNVLDQLCVWGENNRE